MLMNLMNLKNRFMANIKNEEGQGMVEYALLVALIAIVVIVALVLLGPKIANQFNNISAKL